MHQKPTTSPGATVEFAGRVPKDLYDEFKLQFPMYGATTWFINTALANFISLTRDDLDAQEKVAHAIEHMTNNLEQPK